MAERYKSRYGLDWDPSIPDHQIELYLSRFQKLPEYRHADMDDPAEHFLRATRMLFTPREFKISRWTEMIVHGWCHHEETVLMGCASANKSHTCGLIAVLDWATAPHVTTTFFCSTDKGALEKRSWASVLHFYQLLKKQGLAATYSKGKMAILNKEDEHLLSLGIDAPEEAKAGLFAVASESGSEQKASSKFIGVHQPDPMGGVRMFADEAQAVRPSFLESRTNLMIGSEDFRMIALGNPMSRQDPLGQLAEPKKGWPSVSVEDEEWENKTGGHVVHFDGLKSPAQEDPESFPFLIGPKHIEKVLKKVRGDEKHPDYLTMVRGWIADVSDILSVFPEPSQKRLKIHNDAQFLSQPTLLAGLDPAFSGQGDDAVLQIARMGTCVDGVNRIVYGESFYLKVDPDRPESLLEQRCVSALRILRRHRIPLFNLAVDESGVQTVGSTLMIMNQDPTPGNPLLVSFQSRASELPLSAIDPTPTKERFYDQAAEAWSLAERFARFDQIRGLPEEPGDQWSARRWVIGKMPRRLESKDDYREREKRSPDAGDAAALVLLLARTRFGFVPGGAWNVERGESGTEGSNTNFVSELAEQEETLYR